MAPWPHGPMLSTHAMPPGWFGSAATFAVASAVLLKSPPLDPAWIPPSKGRAATHVYLSTHGISWGTHPKIAGICGCSSPLVQQCIRKCLLHSHISIFD